MHVSCQLFVLGECSAHTSSLAVAGFPLRRHFRTVGAWYGRWRWRFAGRHFCAIFAPLAHGTEDGDGGSGVDVFCNVSAQLQMVTSAVEMTFPQSFLWDADGVWRRPKSKPDTGFQKIIICGFFRFGLTFCTWILSADRPALPND